MKAAFINGRIGRDPTAGLSMPKVRAGEPDGRLSPDDVPTRAEVLAILEASPPRFRAAIALGVTGLRIGEVMAVTADRLKLPRLTIDRQLQLVDGTMTFTTPKSDKVRTITLPGIVALELRRHLRDHHGGGLLFRGGRGATMKRYYLYNQAWKPALVGAGLAPDRFKFHSLRHFAASQMLAKGAAITAVAGHLGDTVETIERVYSHWLRDDREVPAQVLDRVLAPETSEPEAMSE
jgi:integrase